MKPKTFYLILASIIIALSVSLFLTRKVIKIPSPLQEIKPQETSLKPATAGLVQGQQTYVPGIKRNTIKRISQETLRPEEIEKKKAARAEITPFSSPSSGSSSSNSPTTAVSAPENTASGNVKIHRGPSTEEVKEMNAQGIMLW